MSKDPFVKVLVESTGAEQVVRESLYERYPGTFRHLGLYEEQGADVEKVEPKAKEPSRQDWMDKAMAAGHTFGTNVTIKELKALLEE